jgi:hypothetical protein
MIIYYHTFVSLVCKYIYIYKPALCLFTCHGNHISFDSVIVAVIPDEETRSMCRETVLNDEARDKYDQIALAIQYALADDDLTAVENLTHDASKLMELIAAENYFADNRQGLYSGLTLRNGGFYGR